MLDSFLEDGPQETQTQELGIFHRISFHETSKLVSCSSNRVVSHSPRDNLLWIMILVLTNHQMMFNSNLSQQLGIGQHAVVGMMPFSRYELSLV